jgi:putative DNA methylase
MTWDFAEAHPFSQGAAGNFMTTLSTILEVLERPADFPGSATVQRHSATAHALPDDSADVLFTDPPYYDAVPYATLADFFYVWLKRAVPERYAAMFSDELIPKDAECVVDEAKNKDHVFFEHTMTDALAEGRRVVRPDGIAVVVFAHKSTAGWEAQLEAMLKSGWVITASWPIDTERENRTRAQNSAALASSVHLVCRPRENPDGSLRVDDVGSWRSVLTELPIRIHEWMPRLAKEGVVGADAIFACLGPALEVFSRYARVEKASGDVVTLREYLEHVWAAVSKEALSMIFEGADATGLEEDARLTAMWLWTLSTGADGAKGADATGEAETAEDDDGADEPGPKGKALTGFVLEFDAARKIAQGLGAHLEQLTDVVEVKGDKARLLPVEERAKHLFAKDDKDDKHTAAKARAKKKQLGLFAEIEAAEQEGLLGTAGAPKLGETTLDRVHQAMILFGAGRSEALKRFVVEDGIGKDARFWKLADSLSKLYPTSAAEKRWVDGVLARKKGLGF